MRLLYFFILTGITLQSIQAQTYQGLDAVRLVNAINGDTLALDYKNSDPLVVIIFTSNFCPYSRKYDDRINDLYQEYHKRDVGLILVNPNTGPDDSLEEMKKKANERSYQFPYLKDPEQILTGVLGATRTPEAFLLRPIQNGFELVYHGAIDDNPQTSLDIQESYLKTAIDDVLNGHLIQTNYVKVTGCIIKK